MKDIQNTENQQDKLNKAALAFGTMGEDGNTRFIESLTSVGQTYDDVSGSAQNMFDSSTTESQKFEASMRQLEQSLIPLGEALMNLANQIIPPLASGIQKIGEFFGSLPEPVQNFVVILGTLIAAFTALAPAIAAVALAVTALEVPLLPIIGIIAGVAAAIAGIIAIVKNWGAITEWFGNLWQTVKDKCSVIWDAICTFFTETIPAAWTLWWRNSRGRLSGGPGCGHRSDSFSPGSGRASATFSRRRSRRPGSPWWPGSRGSPSGGPVSGSRYMTFS